jgi:arylsulfatase A
MKAFDRVFGVCGIVLASTIALGTASAESKHPNIIYILADDLGYGDVKSCNPESKIETPYIDSLAADGMLFTDAHSGSAVCTPTRYGVLTGQYAWRSRLKSGVLGGYSPHLIPTGRETVGSMLRKKGYHTACIGKWHLGMDWAPTEKTQKEEPANYGPMNVDYTKAITNGPNSVGFDYFFGISASLDMPPFIYIENDKTVGVPTTEKKWMRKGPAHVDFEAEDVLPDITAKAVKYISERGHDAAQKPFFLYFPLNSPHTPIVPKAEFQGKSGIGAYGDFVCQTDWVVGEILTALEDNGLTENTLIIFTSDNGCSPQAKFEDLAKLGHNPNYKFRGNKADIYEGGHRVPFLVKWPGIVKAGSRSDQTICLVDLLATVADIVKVTRDNSTGEDSVSLLPALNGTDGGKPLREATVHHSINGSFAIRQGKWKLCECPGSGGWSNPRPGKATKGMLPLQLFDLESDLGETKNVAEANPEVVKSLQALLEKYRTEGRSTPKL